ncbi:MAG: OmpA family protein [Paludibacteraceae bacterium]|nr:OmpA family protein [Paludibacteraceae bacterium]
MTKIIRKIALSTAILLMATVATAQQVTTIYFLENAPMRHTINPAFQPVSNGFINFTPLGWMSFGFGNNSLTMSDVLYIDPVTGKTITPLYPGADKQKFMKQFRNMTFIGGDVTLGLFNFGLRIKDVGYLTIGINQRMTMGVTMPKSLFTFLLDGGMKDLDGGMNTINLTGMGLGATAYTELSGGYSHQLNDQWTIGGKLKLLFGQFYAGFNSKNFAIDAGIEEWRLHGTAALNIAGPVNFTKLPPMDGRTVEEVVNDIQNGDYQTEDFFDYTNIPALIAPSGVGAAIDFGFAWKPIENLQVSAALTDLGFIYWYRGKNVSCSVDTTFTGVGEFNYEDYVDDDGKFDGNRLADTISSNMMGLVQGFRLRDGVGTKARMTSARLNVGLDANFWENRIGIGIVSATRLYNARLYEEVTFGLAFRPVNWFNIAMSYSLLNNGKYSNIGAGISLMPYDGINMTLAMDYMPTSYAGLPREGHTPLYVIPDKMKMFNIALGFSICWGSNRRDKDKDGVWDKIDICPDTPRGVQVDEQGCPLDEDHDGVPDYLDHCLGTPAAAIGFVDSLGCELDTDGDGVEDYRDLCPNTPQAAWGKVDSLGCPMDTDGDGVPDYLDECPETPEAAWTMIDAKGCPIDSDGDGVPDYLDECPNTPQAAWGLVDEKGCPIDSDEDGVPDYRDECPNTPKEAIGHVDARGCELDSDGDGVPDYKDACPYVPGLKNNKGCPEVKREVRQLLQKAMQGIEFETGKATIKKKSFPLLDQIAATFVENSNYIIEVQGHTDNVGKAEYNMKLSDDRANAVRNYLISKGVESTRMTANGYGMEVPIADNKTKAGRQKNRRVEFKISFEEVHVETILDHADPEETPAEGNTEANQ